jgi:electron transport complex protein RnfB
MSLIQRIDALLPQTQCGKCGHPGCKPYAEGLARGEAINKCPPGGDETIAQLAQLLEVPIIALDTERGTALAQVAFIREAECIGCTKCIQACPVDAILGAAKLMHTVIIDECTGCDLCVAPCPVDCIEMHPVSMRAVTPIIGAVALTSAQHAARTAKRNKARHRFEARAARLKREEEQRQTERQARAYRLTPSEQSQQAATNSGAQAPVDVDTELKQARIAVTMTRTQLHRSLKAFGHPPIAAQALRLVELQREFEIAESALERLQTKSRDEPMAVTVKPDMASFNRAKIQLAMRRAALSKAIASDTPADQIALMKVAVDEAQNLLNQLDRQRADSTKT